MVTQFESIAGINSVSEETAPEWRSARNVDSLADHASIRQGMPTQSGLPLDWNADAPAPPNTTRVRRLRLAGKRGFDIVIAAAGLLVLSPLLLTIALAIRLSSEGPALFRQPRVGYKGDHFRIFKFRTMYADKGDPSGRRHTVHGDDRITPLGRFLRRTSLDELPQLINVVLGDMSLVGPRPHVVGQYGGDVPYEALVPYYNQRHDMKPGITGWSQVNGLRGPTNDPELARVRVDHDIAYIQHFTLKLDVRILLGTVWREMTNSSGY